jgi:hypothetical protein
MRSLTRLVNLAVLLLLLWSLLPTISNWSGWQFSQHDWDKDYQSSKVYWLMPGQSLNIDLPSNIKQLRVLLTPAINPGQQAVTTHAKIRYQLFSGDKKPVKTIEQNVVDEPLKYLVEYSDEHLPSRFFDEPTGWQASVSQYFFIAVEKDKPFSQLHIELLTEGMPIALRLYGLEEVPAQQRSIIWQRMNSSQREKVVADHVYPASLVPQQERLAALQHEWLPLGPRGVKGDDFETALLFTRPEQPEPEKVLAANSHILPQAGPEEYLGFYRNEAEGAVRLFCESLSEQPVEWLQLRYQQDFSTQIETLRWHQHLHEGVDVPALNAVFELSASTDCAVKLIKHEDERVLLSNKILGSNQLLPEQKLVFGLPERSRNLQPIKLDIRNLSTEQGRVGWQFFDSQQQPLMAGELALPMGNDPYERLAAPMAGKTLSQRNSVYLRAPAQAVRLEVSGFQGEALVTAFSRPYGLSYLRYPQLGRSEWLQQLTLPKWYLIKPQPVTMAAEQRLRLIWQYRLLQQSEQGSEVSLWQPLEASDNRGKHGLFYRSNVNPAALQAYYPSRYFMALSGQRWQRLLLADPGKQQLSPSLVYQREHSEPQPIKLRIDNGPVIERWLVGAVGRIDLPTLKPGAHRIELLTPIEGQWYLNHGAIEDNVYQLANVYDMAKPITLNIDKQDVQETLTLRYFPRSQQKHRVKVRVSMAAPLAVSENYTVLQREYVIESASTKQFAAALLDTEQHHINPAIALHVLLGADLPRGNYQIHISSDAEQAGYIQAGFRKDTLDHRIEHFYEGENAI